MTYATGDDKPLKVVELFAGIGGFRVGIEKALGKENVEVVYANEWDKWAASIYIRHFAHCDTRDITTVSTAEIPDHDLLVGGFPCQAFSMAGKRAGFEDTRGTLFFDIARILKDKRPRYFLLENVAGLLSHDAGKTFQTILGVLSDLRYDVQWGLVNSKDHGVPQNRVRMFIAGHTRETARPEVFPITEGDADTDDHHPQASDGGINLKVAPTLRANHHNTADVHFVVARPATSTDETEKVRSELMPWGEGWLLRRLTPKEAERLQSFPDDWTRYSHDEKEISDTQRYKCLGNAVTVNVIEAIVRKMIKNIPTREVV